MTSTTGELTLTTRSGSRLSEIGWRRGEKAMFADSVEFLGSHQRSDAARKLRKPASHRLSATDQMRSRGMFRVERVTTVRCTSEYTRDEVVTMLASVTPNQTMNGGLRE
jgi:hypothetical protein